MVSNPTENHWENLFRKKPYFFTLENYYKDTENDNPARSFDTYQIFRSSDNWITPDNFRDAHFKKLTKFFWISQNKWRQYKWKLEDIAAAPQILHILSFRTSTGWLKTVRIFAGFTRSRQRCDGQQGPLNSQAHLPRFEKN